MPSPLIKKMLYRPDLMEVFFSTVVSSSQMTNNSPAPVYLVYRVREAGTGFVYSDEQ